MTFQSCVVGSRELLVRTIDVCICVFVIYINVYLYMCSVYKVQRMRMTFESCVVGSCELLVRTINVCICVFVYMQMRRCVFVFVQCILGTEEENDFRIVCCRLL